MVATISHAELELIGAPDLYLLLRTATGSFKERIRLELDRRYAELKRPPQPDPALCSPDIGYEFPTRYVGLYSTHSVRDLERLAKNLRSMEYLVVRSHYCAIQIALSERALERSSAIPAPNYRNVRRVKPKGKRTEVTAADALLSNDLQVVDFHWCWKTNRGKLAPSGRPFSDWLAAADFPYSAVSAFIAQPLRPATKLKDLGIPDTLQRDLVVLKTREAAKRDKYLRERRAACRKWLQRKAKDNRYIAGQEETWSDVAFAILIERELAGGGEPVAAAVGRRFKAITGRTLHPQSLKKKMAAVEQHWPGLR